MVSQKKKPPTIILKTNSGFFKIGVIIMEGGGGVGV